MVVGCGCLLTVVNDMFRSRENQAWKGKICSVILTARPRVVSGTLYQGNLFFFISPVPFVRFLKASKVTH